MLFDFTLVQENFNRIAKTLNFIDNLHLKDPSWEKLKEKLEHIHKQVLNIDMFIYANFNNHQVSYAPPYGLPDDLYNEVYWRELKTTFKILALLADFKEEHKIKYKPHLP